MRSAACAFGACVLFGLAAFAQDGPAAGPTNWAQWRGPLATGVGPDADPPVEWSETTNVRWKTAIAGRGHSSPVVWGDRIFLTTAVETDKPVDEQTVRQVEADTPEFNRRDAHMPRKVLQFGVLAIKRSDGSVLWRRTVTEEPPQSATHADGSWACGSAVTDGQRVYAYFGSYGLYVLDMDGNPKWAKRLGVFKMKANFGEGVSPTLAGDELIVNQDQEGPSFIAAFDTATGAEKWRVAREETTSWATPLVVEFDGRRQIITSATSRIRSYDAATGELLWQAAGMTGNVIPSPVAGGGIVYCASGFRGSSLMAIRLAAARGDITGKPDALAWSVRKDTPYVPSPLLYGGLLYYTRVNSGALTCVEAATGKVQYGPQAMDELKGLYCSPVAAAGRVYITGRKGLTVVLKAGPTFEVLARNPLDDQFTASAALVGRQIFLRGYRSLYCIAAGQK